MAALTLEQLVQSVEELPSLPDVALKVLKLTEDPLASARDIGAAIAADVALTSRLLRIANSAYYGMARSISTVSDAVVILGMQALRNMAIAAASYDTLKREFAGYGLAAGELWRHSITCAIASQVLARQTRAAKAEEAFVAGLLHDVGKVILNVHVAPQFQAILALAELDAIPFHEAEKCILGFNHAEVGGQIGERWNLPASLCSAIAGHHCLERGSGAPHLTAIVHIANLLCKNEALGLGDPGSRLAISPDALQMLELDEQGLEQATAEILQQMEKLNSVFEFEKAA